MSTEEMIEVMEAFLKGKPIECKPRNLTFTCWESVVDPPWNWKTMEYRVKPEPKPVVKTHEEPHFGQTIRWYGTIDGAPAICGTWNGGAELYQFFGTWMKYRSFNGWQEAKDFIKEHQA